MLGAGGGASVELHGCRRKVEVSRSAIYSTDTYAVLLNRGVAVACDDAVEGGRTFWVAPSMEWVLLT